MTFSFGGLFDGIKNGLSNFAGDAGNQVLGMPVIGDALSKATGVQAPQTITWDQPNANGQMEQTVVGGFNNPTGQKTMPAPSTNPAADPKAALAPLQALMAKRNQGVERPSAPAAPSLQRSNVQLGQLPNLNFGQMLAQRFGKR